MRAAPTGARAGQAATASARGGRRQSPDVSPRVGWVPHPGVHPSEPDGAQVSAAGWPWRAAVTDLLQRTRLAQPDEIAAAVAAAAAPLQVGARMYLVDQEQRILRPVPHPSFAASEPLAVDSTDAGRVFTSVQPLPATADGQPRLWMPMLDGTERLGVLEFLVRDAATLDDPEFRSGCDLFAHLTGHLVATRIPYGDALLKVRRVSRMSEASELVWRLLPPLTFACERVVVSAILEPCYEVGGDGFDYAVDNDTIHFSIFDTAGHELRPVSAPPSSCPPSGPPAGPATGWPRWPAPRTGPSRRTCPSCGSPPPSSANSTSTPAGCGTSTPATRNRWSSGPARWSAR